MYVMADSQMVEMVQGEIPNLSIYGPAPWFPV